MQFSLIFLFTHNIKLIRNTNTNIQIRLEYRRSFLLLSLSFPHALASSFYGQIGNPFLLTEKLSPYAFGCVPIFPAPGMIELPRCVKCSVSFFSRTSNDHPLFWQNFSIASLVSNSNVFGTLPSEPNETYPCKGFSQWLTSPLAVASLNLHGLEMYDAPCDEAIFDGLNPITFLKCSPSRNVFFSKEELLR